MNGVRKFRQLSFRHWRGKGGGGGGGVIAIVNCDRQRLSFRFYQNVKQVNSKIVVYQFGINRQL